MSTVRRSLPTLALSVPVPKVPTNPEPSHFEKLGIQVADLTPSVAEHLGIKTEHGVVITDVRAGSPADQAGLTSGMVITEANRQAVKTVEDFRKALETKPLKKGVLLLGPLGGRQSVRGHRSRVRMSPRFLAAARADDSFTRLRGLWHGMLPPLFPAQIPEALFWDTWTRSAIDR